MHILQVLPYFSPSMGGVARVVYDVARHLSLRGQDITVVAGDYKQEVATFPGGEFRLVLLPSVFSRWGFYYTPALVGWMRDHVAEFDVIHLHEVRTFQNAVARRYALRHGVPYVLSAHGTLPVIVERKLAKRLYDLLLGRALLASASRLVAVSSLEAQQYRQTAGVADGRVQVIYNGLDLDGLSPLPSRGLLRQKLGIPPEAPVVLFLGRLHRIKGIGLLVRAFARLREEARDAVLVIAGPDDGESAVLQALAGRLQLREAIRVAGPLYGREKLAAYVDADVVASPGAYEIFGLVPFEALMCGTPVVVGEGSGAGHLLGEAGAGYLVPPGDVEALADTLRRVVSGGAEVEARVAAGQAFVRRELDWASITGHLEDLYAGVGVECA
jgi:glycosyltransferase involved in cell wall biosynthesis